jgi:hypothetical protein
MEFTGRVKAILPKRSGTSARTGNEWVALPFIFEYLENPTDRYADRVLLETFDTKVIENIKEGMEVRCGFSHNVREYEGKTYNEVRLYKIECVSAANQPAQGANDAAAGNQPTQQVNATQSQQKPAEEEQNDDLPF